MCSRALIGLHLLQCGEPRPRGRQSALQPIAAEVQLPQRRQPAAAAIGATAADADAPADNTTANATTTSTSHSQA